MQISLRRYKDEKEIRLEKFFEKLKPGMQDYLRRGYCLSEDECNDILNESSIILWQNIKWNKVSIDCLGSEEKPSPSYFKIICKNKALELLRSKKNVDRFSPKQDQDKETIQFLPDKIDRILAFDENNCDYQEDKDSLVRSIIKDLPSPCNELLWGYYGNGESIKELAQDFYNGSENAVKVTKHRCTKKFRIRFKIEYQKLLIKYNG